MRPSGRLPVRSPSHRAAVAAWALVAACAGGAAFALALLAERGFALCGRRLGATHHHAAHAGVAMPGMAMPLTPPPADGWCPIVVYAACVAAALALIAVAACLAAGIGPAGACAAFAHLVARAGMGRAAVVATLAGLAPLAVLAGTEPASMSGAVAACVALGVAVAATAAACALVAAARAIVAFGRLVARVVLAVLRLSARPPVPSFVAVRRTPRARGVRLARRRASRAPPLSV